MDSPLEKVGKITSALLDYYASSEFYCLDASSEFYCLDASLSLSCIKPVSLINLHRVCENHTWCNSIFADSQISEQASGNIRNHCWS